ncbi:MAG: peptidoglycan-binding domain-containing protein [Actinobacteria bacterium]|nr:peptidoglycan-binding domain-containing protein [Actinomycetota bacterium]
MNPEDLSEVKSSAYPKLERVPGKQNWVDHAGGLPSYIERIAKHLHYEKGFPIGTAIAIAVNTVKRWASAGTVTKKSGHQVTAKTRAQAAKAVAEWEAKKKSGSANMKAAKAAKSMKESAEDEPQELTLLMEAECLELVADPIDLTEEVANNLVRYYKHPRKAAERLARGTMSDEKGAWKMSAEERAAVADRFTSRLGLLEGVATALSNSESPALSVATGYQFLGASDQPIKLGEVPAADDVAVRGLFAQMEPEIVGLRRAIATLTEAKKKSCNCWNGYERVPGTKPCAPGSCRKCDKARKDKKLDEAKAVSATKCEKCNHSISFHDKNGKCSDCAKAKKLSEASKKGMRGEQMPEPNTEPAGEPKDEISTASDETSRVKHLQSRLDSLGFETKVDGHFGKKTFERVKEFQLHSGLIRDGVVGPKTTEMLRDAPHPDEISIDASPELLPRESASEMGTDSEVSSVIGDDLNLMNPVVPSEVPREPDKFTPPTARPMKKKKKPAKSILFKGLGVGEAQSNPDVKELQADLSATGYKMETDGRFGPQTEQTVKRFQRKYGLKADGVVGDKTMRTLKGVSRHLASIDEAMVEQQFANDATEWADARDTVVQLSRELAESEQKGEVARHATLPRS